MQLDAMTKEQLIFPPFDKPSCDHKTPTFVELIVADDSVVEIMMTDAGELYLEKRLLKP